MADGGFILGLWDRLGAPFRAAWRWLRGRIIGPLQLVPHQPRCFWSPGKRNGRDVMIVNAMFHATSMSSDPIWLVAALLRKPATEGVVSVNYEMRVIGPDCALEPKRRMFARADFFVAPPLRTPGEDFVADVVIVDNLERKHRKRVVFRHR